MLIDGVIYLAGGQQGQGLETAMTNFWALDLARRDDPAAFTWKVLEVPPSSLLIRTPLRGRASPDAAGAG